MRAPETVGLAALALVAAAAVSLVATRPSPDASVASRAFSATLLGPGLGRPVDVSRCAGAFDPRLGPCDLRFEPFPGAGVLCADHAAAAREQRR